MRIRRALGLAGFLAALAGGVLVVRDQRIRCAPARPTGEPNPERPGSIAEIPRQVKPV